MYFYYKNKYENKSKDNEYLPKNLNFTDFKKYRQKLLVGARKRL